MLLQELTASLLHCIHIDTCLKDHWMWETRATYIYFKMLTFLFLNQTLWCDHLLESSRRDDFNQCHIIWLGWERRKLSRKTFCSLFLKCCHVKQDLRTKDVKPFPPDKIFSWTPSNITFIIFKSFLNLYLSFNRFIFFFVKKSRKHVMILI